MMVGTDWHWFFDAEQNRLCIALDGDLQFTVHYRPALYTQDALTTAPFSLDDAEFYQNTLSNLSEIYHLPHPYLVQAALNATAARRYIRPQMPKSWFFIPGSAGLVVETGMIVEMQTTSGHGHFLILEAGEKASLCMLLNSPLTLNESKQMQPFDLIKVMNDRVVNYVSLYGGALEGVEGQLKIAG